MNDISVLYVPYLALSIVVGTLCIGISRLTASKGLLLAGIGFVLFSAQYLALIPGSADVVGPTSWIRQLSYLCGLVLIVSGLLTYLRGHTRKLGRDVAEALLLGVGAIVASTVSSSSPVGQYLVALAFLHVALLAGQTGFQRRDGAYFTIAATACLVPAGVVVAALSGMSIAQVCALSAFFMLVVGISLLGVVVKVSHAGLLAQVIRAETAHESVERLSTQLKQQVDVLSATSHKLSVVLGAGGFRVWEADLATGRLSSAVSGDTPAGQLLFGTATELFAAIIPEDRERVLSAWQAITEGASKRLTAEFTVDHQGQRRTLSTHAERLDAENGRPRLLVGVTKDVTEVVGAREADNERKRLVRANQVKSEFMSHLSHELRTPLNAVLGFGRLINEDLDNSEAARESAGFVVQAGQHMMGLVTQVLELACLESGAEQVDISKPVQLAAVMQATQTLSESLAMQQGIRLEWVLPDSNVWVVGNEMRIRQILLNLVSNAIKYNRPKGVVRVWVEDTGDKQNIRVEDTGPGLSEEQVSRLFVAFERLGHRKGGRTEGHGLGLALSRQLAQAMDGQMGVASVVGEGSVFTLSLSSAPPAKIADTVAAIEVPAAASSPDVLYVEDNEANARIMREMFAKRPQLRLHWTETVEEGLAQFKRVKPGLVLVDLLLKDERGEDVLKGLRQLGFEGMVVAVSANALSADRARALRAGFDAFWVKPLRIAECLEDLDLWTAPQSAAA